MSDRWTWPALAAAVAALAALTACPAPDDENPARASARADVAPDAGACPDVPVLLARSCAGASCHSAKDHAGELDLASPGLPDRLVGLSAKGGPGLMIDPAYPETSVLYTKLSATPPFAGRMPIGPPLDDATAACVLAWVGKAGPGVATSPVEDGGAPTGDGTCGAVGTEARQVSFSDPDAGPPLCDVCVATNCCAETAACFATGDAGGPSECAEVVDCLRKAGPWCDASCQKACEAAHPAGVAAAKDFTKCFYPNCVSFSDSPCKGFCAGGAVRDPRCTYL